MHNKFFSKIRMYFFSGVLVIGPILITIYIVQITINLFDHLLISILATFGKTFYVPPGSGLVLSLLAITIIGFVTANFLGRYFIKTANYLIMKLPVVKAVYNTAKQIFETILSNKSKAFKKVALIEYPRLGIWTLAFVTSTARGEIQEKTEHKVVTVFIPTTPNPTSGFLLLVPEKDLIWLNMPPEKAMKLIITGGLLNEEV